MSAHHAPTLNLPTNIIPPATLRADRGPEFDMFCEKIFAEMCRDIGLSPYDISCMIDGVRAEDPQHAIAQALAAHKPHQALNTANMLTAYAHVYDRQVAQAKQRLEEESRRRATQAVAA